MFLTKNPFSDHGPSKQVLSEAIKYHIPEDIPANERTAFHGAAAAAAKAGKKNFNFGGKTHPVTMKKDLASKIADQKEGSVKEDPAHYAAIAKANAAKQAERDKADPEGAKKREKAKAAINKKFSKNPVKPADIGRHSSQGGGFIGRRNESVESVNESFSYHNDMAKAHKSHAMRHNSEFHHGNHNYDDEDMHGRAIDIHKQAHAAHIQARNLSSYDSEGKYKKAAKDAHSLSQTAIGTTKDAGKFKTGKPKHSFPKLVSPTKLAKESTVKEISKGLAMRNIGKASRDVYHKGQQQGADDAISRLGGPTKPYKKSPERKAAKRVAGIDRATKITSMRPLSYPIGRQGGNEATTTDAERKAMDDFIKKGKMKKLKPGYAQGYHGKADPGAGIKGMIDKGDTKQFGTKKKIGSMK